MNAVALRVQAATLRVQAAALTMKAISPRPRMGTFLRWRRPKRRLKVQMLWRWPWMQSCRSSVLQRLPWSRLTQMLWRQPWVQKLPLLPEFAW